MRDYVRADFTPLRDTVYGVGVHWTTWTLPRDGDPVPFPEAVERFDVPAFVDLARDCGAGHVLFTATHELHWLPGPNPEVDRILPGRTCKRDLIREIADGLRRAGISFVLYYNHGTYNAAGYTQDPEWQEAVGARKPDRSEYYDNYCRVVSWMGEHYGDRVIAFWMDSGQEHVKHSDTPWERFTAAAKAGYPGRLVTYNSGILNQQSYTDFQDFWAGEANGLNYHPPPPTPDGRFPTTGAGLPFYAFCSWAAYDPYFRIAEWGMSERARAHTWPEIDPEAAAAYVEGFRNAGGAVTFNLLCYQDGSVLESDRRTMRGVRKIIRGR